MNPRTEINRLAQDLSALDPARPHPVHDLMGRLMRDSDAYLLAIRFTRRLQLLHPDGLSNREAMDDAVSGDPELSDLAQQLAAVLEGGW